jgi:aminoglycoside 3-N-acetyltransferase I
MMLATASWAQQAGDVGLLRALLGVFGEAFEDRDTRVARQPDDACLGRLLSNPDFVAIVAQRDGAVVGGLAGCVLPKFKTTRSDFYIHDLAIAPEHAAPPA